MCKFAVLASRGPFRVDVCEDCSCVHVHIGPVSFRLDESAVGTLSGVLLEALARKEALSQQSSWTPSFSQSSCN